MPLVTVIIPCYNYARFLPEAVASVRAQALEDWELLVVNDGSTDDSLAVAWGLAAEEPRMHVIDQPNAGLSAARNAGLAAAAGALVQFLDADDRLHPEKLALQAAYLARHPEPDAVWGSWEFFPDVQTGGPSHPPASLHGAAFLTALLRNNLMPVSAPLLRRTLTDRVGLFETAYTSYEDWQYWIRAALAGARFDFLAVPHPATGIRKGHPSMMQHRLRMIENGLRLRRFLRPHLRFREGGYNAYRMAKLQAHRWVVKTGLVR